MFYISRPKNAKIQVLIDDYDIRTMNVPYLRQLYGVVSQEPVLFDGTLEENVRLGKEDATFDEIYEALRIANAKNFVEQLPEGENCSFA